MADYINRDDLRNALYESDTLTIEGLGILNRFPAADVVEVVRCKNCKFGDSAYLQKFISEDAPPSIICVQYKRIVEADEFCSYGRKRG